MVTSFYMMNTFMNKRSIDIGKYYENLCNQNIGKFSNTSLQKCRVCLKEGFFSIYGERNTSEIIEALHNLTNIEISELDIYPKYLCKICFKFLRDAKLFKKIAKRTDDLLKEYIKEEANDNIDYSHEFVDAELSHPSPDWCNEETMSIDLKTPKKEKSSKGDVMAIAVKAKEEKIKVSTKIQCNICNKIINKSYYKEHMTMHDPDHYKYICDVCGKTFRLRCAYHNHSLRHRKDYPFTCQLCPYKARYAELLKTHLRTHSGDYRYMCTECPARFLFKSNLNSHMFKHKDPQYKCEACKRGFHTKVALQKHFDADHLGIKNHVCNICGKAFGYRNAMTKHQRHVHKREKLRFSRMPSYLQVDEKRNE